MGRVTILCGVLGLLVGCYRNSAPPRPRGPGYPALDESPPPPPPVSLVGAVEEDPRATTEPVSPKPPETVVDDRMLSQLARDQADELRKYAAESEPDDPFALSEEEIRKLEGDDAPLVR